MLLDDIKKDQLNARKNKDSETTATLTTLIGEAEKIGKDDGNRLTTDLEVVTVIKKFIKGLNETLLAVRQRSNSADIINKTQNEIRVIEKYLPKQLSKEKLTFIISEYIGVLDNTSPKQMGVVMKYLKEHHAGTFDGKTASLIVKQQLIKATNEREQ